MMASRSTAAAAAGAQTSMICVPRLLHSRPSTQLHAMPPRSPSKLASITASDPTSALGYFNKDLSRRRSAAPEVNDQDNQSVRLSAPQASASALINTARERAEDGYSFTASGRTDIIAWVELECLSLQASMEDMLVSMGSGEYCSDLGNGMQY